MLKTPQTHPDDLVVGHNFKSSYGIYYCDSYDPDMGYWMTNIHTIDDRRNVSERAINATFHHIWSYCPHKDCQFGGAH